MGERIATIVELWRYPVKGMRGERVMSLDLDALGVAGDRRFAIRSSGAPRGKPLLTGAERACMLLYRATGEGSAIQVETPGGKTFGVDDPRLLVHMQAQLPGGHALCLLRSGRPLTDVRPVALLGTGSVAQISRERAVNVDSRRFRANLVLHLAEPFAEDGLAGRLLRLGSDAVLRVTERTPRCRIVTLDPETAVADPALMKHLDRQRGGRIGVYATVAAPGTLRLGDVVTMA